MELGDSDNDSTGGVSKITLPVDWQISLAARINIEAERASRSLSSALEFTITELVEGEEGRFGLYLSIVNCDTTDPTLLAVDVVFVVA